MSAKKEQAKTEKKSSKKTENPKLAAVLIRGFIKLPPQAKYTLNLLKLRKKHGCAVIDNNDSTLGMLRKVKDFIAYGELEEDTFKELQKRDESQKEGILFFRLAPPRGGFERKGIKADYNKGGAVGYRGKEINALIKRMLP